MIERILDCREIKYLLDTNVYIKYLNEDLIISRKLESTDLEDIAVC
jgi:tRNA(fMet)-specific endonuclease VapC